MEIRLMLDNTIYPEELDKDDFFKDRLYEEDFLGFYFRRKFAPGVVIANRMADIAFEEARGKFELEKIAVVCETDFCIPDALSAKLGVTVGNRYLKVLDWQIMGFTVYDYLHGRGVRVWVDSEKVRKNGGVFERWYFRKTTKAERKDRKVRWKMGVEVLREFLKSPRDYLSWSLVKVANWLIGKAPIKEVKECPKCHITYTCEGDVCPVCAGKGYFEVLS